MGKSLGDSSRILPEDTADAIVRAWTRALNLQADAARLSGSGYLPEELAARTRADEAHREAVALVYSLTRWGA